MKGWRGGEEECVGFNSYYLDIVDTLVGCIVQKSRPSSKLATTGQKWTSLVA